MEVVYSEFVKNFGEQVLLNESMKNHTSFKIGGTADILFLPKNIDDICKAIDLCKKYDIIYYIMGNGSNLLVRDEGFRGVIIKISSAFKNYKITDTEIICQSGILLYDLAKILLNNELKGFEFAYGIPGTLGGAVCMNAGAYGGEIKDVLDKVTVLTENGEIINLYNENLELGYRTSSIQKNNFIVLDAKLKFIKGNKIDIKLKMDELMKLRRDKQPLNYPSAGSTFKRPPGYFAGKLIMDSGLQGYTIGEAQVSTKHCGFIINKGNATAINVLNLIEHIKATVFDKFNVVLEPEVKIIG